MKYLKQQILNASQRLGMVTFKLSLLALKTNRRRLFMFIDDINTWQVLAHQKLQARWPSCSSLKLKNPLKKL